MENVKVNINPVLMEGFNRVVKEEQYKSKSDAITDMRFTSIIEGTENLPCLTEAVIQSPEEEDERL